jgi:hypothetical protein
MRKIKPEAICKLPNLTFKLGKSAQRMAAKEAALEAAQKEFDAEKALFFERLIAEYGYEALIEAGVL